jgi:ligand-binding SRPBCC domain-containing protein
MASASFHYRYFINAPASQIYAHLSEPNSYIGLSPLVTEVSHVTQLANAEVPAVQYEAVETFHFLGFIRYPNRIKVRLVLTKPDAQMVHLVESIPNVRLRFTFDFQPGDGGTWIDENVTATMPLPLRGYVVSQAKSVQQARAHILKKRMELS